MEKKKDGRRSVVTKGRLKTLAGALMVFSVALLALLGGCAQKEEGTKEDRALKGNVRVDGSSTVYPITEAVAEEFQKENPNVRVIVGASGTGGGFKKFALGEIDINNASRPIKEEEKKECEEKGIEYLELKVAFDGIAVVVNPENDWCKDLSVEELKKIWEPESKVKKWSDIRPEWPGEEIVLFGPDTDSGTFDYFTEAVVGEEGKSRSDYTASTDDNVLVEGVAGEKYGLGYFGFAYYEKNQNKLKALKVNGVSPAFESIRSGKYAPLSRPLFIYVNKKSLKRTEIFAFVKYYLENAPNLIPDVGYVPLPTAEYQKALGIVEGAR